MLRLCSEDLRLAISFRSNLIDCVLVMTFFFPKRVEILVGSFFQGFPNNNQRYLSTGPPSTAHTRYTRDSAADVNNC
jgi:hypothetical protein